MKRPEKNKEQGQSLVEFAITLPVLLLILSGLMDLGRAYYTFVALEEAVAEAALYLAISPDCPDYDLTLKDECSDPNNAIYRAVNAGNDEFDPNLAEWNIPFTTAKETSEFRPGENWSNPFPPPVSGTPSIPGVTLGCTTIGCNVLVQVRYPFELLTPGMQAFLPGNATTIPLRTQAAQIIVYEQR